VNDRGLIEPVAEIASLAAGGHAAKFALFASWRRDRELTSAAPASHAHAVSLNLRALQGGSPECAGAGSLTRVHHTDLDRLRGRCMALSLNTSQTSDPESRKVKQGD
jgi:hypothetical protein